MWGIWCGSLVAFGSPVSIFLNNLKEATYQNSYLLYFEIIGFVEVLTMSEEDKAMQLMQDAKKKLESSKGFLGSLFG